MKVDGNEYEVKTLKSKFSVSYELDLHEPSKFEIIRYWLWDILHGRFRKLTFKSLKKEVVDKLADEMREEIDKEIIKMLTEKK